MIVQHLVQVADQGILVKGRVEGATIQVGEAVKIGDSDTSPTVRVGQISVEKKPALQAVPEVEAMLLLCGLNPENIRPGVRLVPGDIGDVVLPPEEKPWEVLSERILPIRRTRDYLGNIGPLILMGVFLIIPVVVTIFLITQIGLEEAIQELWWLFLFFLVWDAILAWAFVQAFRALMDRLYARKVFLAGTATTLARILAKRTVFHSGKYNDYYTYHLQVEFNPTQVSVPAGQVRYELQINHGLYERLKAGPINLTYATHDPQVFMIEGE
jgi:hypothetical protein